MPPLQQQIMQLLRVGTSRIVHISYAPLIIKPMPLQETSMDLFALLVMTPATCQAQYYYSSSIYIAVLFIDIAKSSMHHFTLLKSRGDKETQGRIRAYEHTTLLSEHKRCKITPALSSLLMIQFLGEINNNTRRNTLLITVSFVACILNSDLSDAQLSVS